MMNKIFFGLFALILMLNANAQERSSAIRCFDNDWTFHSGEVQGAESPDFNDTGWRHLDLPHDWSIEDLKPGYSPFYRYAIGQASEGFTVQGTGWYRKEFFVPLSETGKIISIQFDGVYMNSDVYVNGKHLGNHPYGYTSFYYDITGAIKFGGRNIIAVEVKNEGQNSRWYAGSGIYRHVWLKIMSPAHIVNWGTSITTPQVSAQSAKVRINTMLINQATSPAALEIKTRIIDNTGRIAAQSDKQLNLNESQKRGITDSVSIDHPKLWSCESPVLYTAITELFQNQHLISADTNLFGIRSISFDAEKGFQLNGSTLKLKGGCFHLDNGPLGTRAYDRAEERKVELLKASGFNAIRCSHNPPSPFFLASCDRLGMLVIDEAFDMWNIGKTPYDYHLYFKDWWKNDLESMVMRDRNHPSVIMWSIGNEIPERAEQSGAQTAKMLAAFVKELDPSRPITAAVNGMAPDKDDFFSTLDVCGYNYAEGGGGVAPDIYRFDHNRLPGRVMMGTESYPLEAFNSWLSVQDNPYVIGDFVWTAWDYIGEASIGWLGYPQTNNFYPWNLAFCGDIDICGWKRPQSFYRDVLWKADQLSLFVRPPVPSFQTNPQQTDWSKWNWLDAISEWNFSGFESKPLQVSVYSSCEQAELFLNGRSLGIRNTDRSNRFIATWLVPYQPGSLKAVGYRNGRAVGTAMLNTASKPAKIKLTADRIELKSNNQDLCYLTVEITDAAGNINQVAKSLVHFKLSGDAKIVGVGNGDPRSIESYQLPQRETWKGRCMVIVKTGKKPGKITLVATGNDLKQAEITLLSK